MLERFTDRARRVMVLAQDEARMLRDGSIAAGRIVAGLIHGGAGLAAPGARSRCGAGRRQVRPGRRRRGAAMSSAAERIPRQARPGTRTVVVAGTPLRVAIRPGTGAGPPLLLANGIGASLETLQPFVDALDPAIEVIRFDVPGVGGSPLPAQALPVRHPGLAAARAAQQARLPGRRHPRHLLGRRAGPAVRAVQPAPVPAADPGGDSNRATDDGAGQSAGADEDARPAPVPGSRITPAGSPVGSTEEARERTRIRSPGSSHQEPLAGPLRGYSYLQARRASG